MATGRSLAMAVHREARQTVMTEGYATKQSHLMVEGRGMCQSLDLVSADQGGESVALNYATAAPGCRGQAAADRMAGRRGSRERRTKMTLRPRQILKSSMRMPICSS
mmetsp:Transcript_40254/g.115067  ORF Transcript_40254/g.115067 Transcript_40254/m.115067 type:complete len:107 (-) Transcript_40254:881-1201(-)